MALVLLLMYLPIVVTAVYSFNANQSRFTFQFTGFSLQHYKALFQDTSGLLDALWQSLQLALYSCLISAALGTLGAVGMARRKIPARRNFGRAGAFAGHDSGDHYGRWAF